MLEAIVVCVYVKGPPKEVSMCHKMIVKKISGIYEVI